MHRSPLGGLTIKAALTLGFGLTLGLWLLTGYRSAGGLADLERDAAATAARYVQAQELLSTFRSQVLATSGTVRDALLDRREIPWASYTAQLDERLSDVHRMLRGYTFVLDSDGERDSLDRLQRETTAFSDELRQTLAVEPSETTGGRRRFSTAVLPRRTSLLRAIEDLQAFNRGAFVQYRGDLSARHSTAEAEMWRHLGLALFGGLGIAVIATLYASRLERRLVTQLERDARNTQALQDLSTRLITAQEEERRRIARELHDEVGQALTAIKVELSVAQDAIVTVGGSSQLLSAAQAITNDTLHTVRDLSRLLHPSVLDDLGLPEALDAYASEFSKRFDIAVQLHHEGMAARLRPDIEVAAYRMIQEALTNVARHAGASRVHITLQRRLGELAIEVKDNGVGFTPAPDGAPTRNGLGLIGMRERALQLAGRLVVDSLPGRGTTIRIDLPAVAPDAAPDLPSGLPAQAGSGDG